MKQKLIVFSALLLGAAMTISAAAPTDQDYVKWMKGAAAACGRVKKNVEAKANAADLAKDATELSTNFKGIGSYWKAKKADEAVKWSKDAGDAGKLIAKAAKAGKFDVAAVQFKALTSTCGPCHGAHREKAKDGSWKIK